MASPHFLLFPFMAQGHSIPMIDLAKLLAHRGATVTIVTTPLNAARHHSVLSRAKQSGLQINVIELQFPVQDSGLPQGCENVDLLPSPSSVSAFFRSTFLLFDPSDELFKKLTPPPTCIVSDLCLPWTLRLARKHNIPRLVFYSLSFFFLLCLQSLEIKKPLLLSLSDSDFVTLIEFPDQKFQFRKAQLPAHTDDDLENFSKEIKEADQKSDGVIINVFEEMELKYFTEYKKIIDYPERVWCVGPVSLCNADELDRAERGNRASMDEQECIKFLDGQEKSSVIYVSLGSLCNLVTTQLMELGLGLEESRKPFIWVIRKEIITEELRKWLEDYEFEKKVKGRGILIRGWAPQVLLLSQPGIGCFLTHCGWNSSIEGMVAGVPMITLPLFADQVFNETMIVEILRIGVRVGMEVPLQWGEKGEKGVLVKRNRVREAIEMVMDRGDEMRERSKKLAEMANRALKEGGSSHRNLTLLIEDIKTFAQNKL